MDDQSLLILKREHSLLFCVFIFKDLKNLFNFILFAFLGKAAGYTLKNSFSK